VYLCWATASPSSWSRSICRSLAVYSRLGSVTGGGLASLPVRREVEVQSGYPSVPCLIPVEAALSATTPLGHHLHRQPRGSATRRTP
jgi:hypothetical protein